MAVGTRKQWNDRSLSFFLKRNIGNDFVFFKFFCIFFLVFCLKMCICRRITVITITNNNLFSAFLRQDNIIPLLSGNHCMID